MVYRVLTSKELIEILWFNNIDVKNHMSPITKEQLEIISKHLNIENKIRNNNSSSLKMIEIRGLFNYYNYRINLEQDVNIFVAENGFGKTTILNIPS